jgi:3-oxoacyl-[acyl-carrier protein] reductase
VASINAAGGSAVAMHADMSESADVVRLFDQVKADYSKVDIVVNNAAIAVFGMVAELTEEDFHKQFNLNVLGYFPVIREAVKHFGKPAASSSTSAHMWAPIPLQPPASMRRQRVPWTR